MEIEKIFKHFQDSKNCCYVNEIFLILKRRSIRLKPITKYEIGKIYLLFMASISASAILLLINLPFKMEYDYNKKMAIARVHSEKYKIKNLYNEIQFIEDDIKNFDFTIYKIGSRFERLHFIMSNYIRSCLKDFSEIMQLLELDELKNYKTSILIEYVKRIPHTIVFKHAAEYIIRRYNLKVLYTAANCERFGLIAQDISKRYGKKLVCIPHGIETTDEVPAGYVGDVFYSTSPLMAKMLNELYKTSKFIFSDQINSKIYKIAEPDFKELIKNKPKVVFFTHPTNKISLESIVKDIAKYMQGKEEKLFLKVHPRENRSKYEIENTEFVNDIKEAIVGNLCISLYSTVLLEALYNESKAVSVINLFKDTEEFDDDYEYLVHLRDDRIIKPINLEKLFNEIDNHLENRRGFI